MDALLASLSLAFGTGMIATFNPCGFALLPAYLSYFLGLESAQERNPAYNILRGLIVGLTLTAGFLLVFSTIGWLASSLFSQSAVRDPLSWATFVIGILMIPLGIAMLAGFDPKISLPRLNKGGTSRQLPSVFLFGVSFAVVSLGCTLPAFFTNVVNASTAHSAWEGTFIFLAYGSGMGLVVMILTMATAMSRTEVAVAMRKVLPHVNKISGVLLILAGAFLVVYGWYEVQTLRGNLDANWLVIQSEEFQTNVTNWVYGIGELRLAMALVMLLAMPLGLVVWDIITHGKPAEEVMSKRLWHWSVWMPLWLVALLALEIFRYDWELLTLPVWRTFIDIPSRIGGWFSNPVRWAVLFEILATAIAAFFVWLRIRQLRMRRQSGADGSGPDDPTGAGLADEATPVASATTAS